jgi:hypothetical protein
MPILTVVGGHTEVSLSRDHDGYREYKITHLVRAAGPASALVAPGLPVVGSMWQLPSGDFDSWVWCYPDARVTLHKHEEGEPHSIYCVEQTFGNKQSRRCQDTPIENPLMEPMKVSGSFVRYTEGASHDRYGVELSYSNGEMIQGPQIEFDKSRPTVRVEQNIANLGLEDWAPMIDTVNDDTLWGIPARCIKFSQPSWERKVWGSCAFYFTRIFDFEVRYGSWVYIDGELTWVPGFDRAIPDEGTVVLKGDWDRTVDPAVWVPDAGTDQYNYQDYMPFFDSKSGNPVHARLDGYGNPANDDDRPPHTFVVEKYDESNFLLFGIPTNLAFSR